MHLFRLILETIIHITYHQWIVIIRQVTKSMYYFVVSIRILICEWMGLKIKQIRVGAIRHVILHDLLSSS